MNRYCKLCKRSEGKEHDPMCSLRGTVTREQTYESPPPSPVMFLVALRKFDDTYYRTVMAERMLNTPEMQGLRKLAQGQGFRVDLERLDSIEDMERFLGQLGEVA